MKIQTTFIKSKQTKFIIKKKKKKNQFHSTNQNHTQITKNPNPQNQKFPSHKTPKKAKMFVTLAVIRARQRDKLKHRHQHAWRTFQS